MIPRPACAAFCSRHFYPAPRPVSVWALCLLVWTALFAGTSSVSAHSQLQNSLWVLFESDALRVGVSVTEKEVAVVQGGEPGSLQEAQIQAHAGYLLQHLFFEANGRMLAGMLERVNPPPDSADPEHRAHVYEFRYPANGVNRVKVWHRMLEEHPYGPGQAWDVSYVIRCKVSGSETVTSELLRAGPGVLLPPEGAESGPSGDGGRTFLSYLEAGVAHILAGYDHLLFVGGLVFGAAGFWAVLRVVGFFTLAHTVTLAMATMGWVHLPSAVVEPLIAASIVFVGVENWLWPRRASGAGRAAVAFGFGLMHGLGFAGGLLEAMAGLPPSRMGLALVGFSVGVETGHLLVVIPLFLLLKALRSSQPQDAPHPAWLRAASALVAAAGAFYLVRALLPGAAPV